MLMVISDASITKRETESDMFELKTLTHHSDESLLAELRQVAGALHGQRLTLQKFNQRTRLEGRAGGRQSVGA
jgi:hypothetical protein